MRRQKAKSPDNDDTIYWTFEDIIEFTEEKKGLVSIHAGKKLVELIRRLQMQFL